MAKSKDQLDKEKKLAGETVARWIPSGALIGIGSGTTAAYFIRELGRRVREEGLRVTGVPTSEESEQLSRELGIPLTEPRRGLMLDFVVDGADELTPELHLIKGGGGKLFREKVIATASKYMIIIADSSKPVPVLGKFPLPVEVVPFSEPFILDRISELGANPVLRQRAGSTFLTDQNNWIIDCHFHAIPDPLSLGEKLKRITGVLDHGLFLNMAKLAVVADGNFAFLLRPGRSPVACETFATLPAL
ncbi:MAG TPA: ribose-5-phosphate isomerase RpiA [Terriglobales bacterium]